MRRLVGFSALAMMLTGSPLRASTLTFENVLADRGSIVFSPGRAAVTVTNWGIDYLVVSDGGLPVQYRPGRPRVHLRYRRRRCAGILRRWLRPVWDHHHIRLQLHADRRQLPPDRGSDTGSRAFAAVVVRRQSHRRCARRFSATDPHLPIRSGRWDRLAVDPTEPGARPGSRERVAVHVPRTRRNRIRALRPIR